MWALLACAPPAPSTGPLLGTGGDVDAPVTELGAAPRDTAVLDPYPREVETPEVRFNEVMADNEWTLYLDGAYPDWIELFNPSGSPVALDRITIEDASGRVWMGGEGELPGFGWLLLYADDEEGDDHAPFAIDADGDTLTLAVDGAITDRLATGAIAADIAWARFPDGGDWAPTLDSTPGATNGAEPSATLEPTAAVFDDTLHTVTISLEPDDRASLLEDPDTYVEARVGFDGSTLAPVGLRLRGTSTFQDIDGKCSMRIDTDQYADIHYRGLEHIQLVNMIWDPSYVREAVSYQLFRGLDVPAARTAYAWVEMDEAPKGLYLVLEAYDEAFLDDWFGGADGELWEPGIADLTSDASLWDCEIGECDPTDLEPVAALLLDDPTDANVASLETYLDLDRALRMIAGEIAVGQWDGYCAPHNWRIYRDPTDERLTLLPSSLDLTFDNLGYQYGHDYFACGGVLLDWCLDNASCEARYEAILDDLADRIVGDLGLLEQIDAAEVLVDAAAQADAGTGLTEYTYEDHQAQLAEIRRYLLDEPARIRAQLDAR